MRRGRKKTMKKSRKRRWDGGVKETFFILSPFLFLHESHFKVSILVLFRSFFYPSNVIFGKGFLSSCVSYSAGMYPLCFPVRWFCTFLLLPLDPAVFVFVFVFVFVCHRRGRKRRRPTFHLLLPGKRFGNRQEFFSNISLFCLLL